MDIEVVLDEDTEAEAQVARAVDHHHLEVLDQEEDIDLTNQLEQNQEDIEEDQEVLVEEVEEVQLDLDRLHHLLREVQDHLAQIKEVEDGVAQTTDNKPTFNCQKTVKNL